MRTKKPLLDLAKIAGYRWQANGQSIFSGTVLDRLESLEGLHKQWAAAVKAEEWRLPIFISAQQLDKADYLRSFPHLATFPAALAADDENFRRFTEGPVVDYQGRLELTRTAPIRDVLTPAACYHFYSNLEGSKLTKEKRLTTSAHCFRREHEFKPLDRQWDFTMREIVSLGTADEVDSFAAGMKRRITQWCEQAKLRVEWKAATDPFFNPARNPKALMQKLAPIKTELVFDGKLAIGSIHLHGDYFGECYDIRRGSSPVYSACVAFGLERWLYALLTQFGLRRTDWPLPLKGI